MKVVFNAYRLVNVCNEFISRVVKEGPMIDSISIIPVGEGESDKGVNDFLSPCLSSDVRRR